jgi:two-component system cell cycle sensor histidine kinase/response regulator CckA
MSGKTILLVDDEQMVRAYVRNILKSDGFDIVEAADGVEALAIIQQLDGAINLLLTDVRMPRMDGIELAHKVSDTYPHIPVLFISGYALDIEVEKNRHPKKACGFVSKPFRPQPLREAVRKCIEGQTQTTETMVSA